MPLTVTLDCLFSRVTQELIASTPGMKRTGMMEAIDVVTDGLDREPAYTSERRNGEKRGQEKRGQGETGEDQVLQCHI